MERYTKRQLKDLVAQGVAKDVTNATDKNRHEMIPEAVTQIGYASGIYGCNGMLLKGLETGKLYAVTDRTTAIYLF